MRKIKKIRNVILVIIILLLSAFLGLGMFMKASLLDGFDIDKAYMYEPPGADITIVDFNQFGCDVCQNVYPILKEAMAKDGKVRYIPRVVLSSNEFEDTIVHAVYASALQNKFTQMHNAIYESWPVGSRSELLSIAERLGLDTAQLQIDMDSEEVKQKVQETENLFEAWKLPSVPAFLIDRKILYVPKRDELPTVETWLEKFERVRKK